MSPTYLPQCFSTRLYYIVANFASDLGKDSTYWLPLPHRPLAALHVAHSASCLPVACGLHKILAAQPISAFTSVIHHIDQAASSDRRGRAHQHVLSCFFYGSMLGGHIQSALGDFGHGCTWRRRRMKVWVFSSAYLLKLVYVLYADSGISDSENDKRMNNGWNHG